MRLAELFLQNLGTRKLKINRMIQDPSQNLDENENNLYLTPSDYQLNRKRINTILKSVPGALKNINEASKIFQPIKKSIYLDRKQKVLSEDDIYICDCVKSTKATSEQLSDPRVSIDCGQKCINRLMCTECEMNSCPAVESCQNRKFQQQLDKCVYPFKAGAKGWGLKTAEFISKSSFVLQYIGEIFSVKSSEGIKRMAQCAQSTCTYLMKLSSKELIDPTLKGSIARFINHSCEPNCITQKWNVLGEVVVGIFAIKDIQVGEELTFDYKFDVYKTPLSICYCGTNTCRGYLGLRPLNYTNEEWENKMNNLPCEICKGNYENDDDRLLVCDKCNNGFHLECLTPSLNSVPKGAWFCPECSVSSLQENSSEQKLENPSILTENRNAETEANLVTDDIRSRKKQQFFDLKVKVFKEFDSMCMSRGFYALLNDQNSIEKINANSEIILKKYILTMLELSIFKERGAKLISEFPNIRFFWGKNEHYHRQYFLKQIEVSINCSSTQSEFIDLLFDLIEESTKNFKESIGSAEKSFKIPAIFLKRVLGEYYTNLKSVEREFNVKVHFNKKHVTDDCFPIHYLTTIILKSRSENIAKAHSFIKQKMSELVARRKYMSRSDIKIIISKLSHIKKEIGPTEIRCCRDNALRDINHPFFTIYYKDKEVAFIGTLEEVLRAERKVIEIIESNRKFEDTSTSLNFLIPVCDKTILINIKNKSEKNFPGSKMILYDPLYPRKNISVTLSSSYREFDEYLDYFKHQLDKREIYGFNFETYQIQMLHQMSKHFFKYLHNYKQTNSMFFMKSWDNLTAEFDANYRTYNSSMKIVENKIFHDPEFLFYVIRVNSLYKRENLSKIGMSVEGLIEILKNTLSRKNEMTSNEYSIFISEKTIKPMATLELVHHISTNSLHKNDQIMNAQEYDYQGNYRFRQSYQSTQLVQQESFNDLESPIANFESRRPFYGERNGLVERDEYKKKNYERIESPIRKREKFSKEYWYKDNRSNSSQRSYEKRDSYDKYKKESRFQKRNIDQSENNSSHSSRKYANPQYKPDFEYEKIAYKNDPRNYREDLKVYLPVPRSGYSHNQSEYKNYINEDYPQSKYREQPEEFTMRENRYSRIKQEPTEFRRDECNKYDRNFSVARNQNRERERFQNNQRKEHSDISSSVSEERKHCHYQKRKQEMPRDYSSNRRPNQNEISEFDMSKHQFSFNHYNPSKYNDYSDVQNREMKRREQYDDCKFDFSKRRKY